jgi:hypothetical protein
MRHKSRILRSLAWSIGLAASCLICAQAGAATIDVSTSNADWTASYSGFSGTAFHYSCGAVDCISISSTGLPGGTFVGGGTAGDFTGTWTATLDFFLPANAQNVRYTFASVGVDDRATLSLNGVTVGTFYINGPQISGTISNSASFVLGGTNTLTLLAVNNPGDQTGPPVGFQDAFDGTAIALGGQVTYSVLTALPTLSFWALVLLGLGLAGFAATRRRTLR